MDQHTEARFWARATITDSECIEYAGKGVHGYGVFRVDGQRAYAHRIAYELLNGPIPEGLSLDHLCGNRSCINPDHLEAVTGAENTRRGCGKITPQIAATIEEAAQAGHDVVAIANLVGLSEATISRHLAREYIATASKQKQGLTSTPALRLA